MNQWGHAYGQLFVSVYKLASGVGDLQCRLIAARDELKASVCVSELPSCLRDTYAALLDADVEAMTRQEDLIKLSGRIVSLAFAACEAQAQTTGQNDAMDRLGALPRLTATA